MSMTYWLMPQLPVRIEAGYLAFKWKVGVGRVEDELGILDDLLAALGDDGVVEAQARVERPAVVVAAHFLRRGARCRASAARRPP